jgi:hypothetical protein
MIIAYRGVDAVHCGREVRRGTALANKTDALDPASQVIIRLLEKLGTPTPPTKVVTLVYLIDYTYFQHYGATLSGLQYQWHHYGPNALGRGILARAENLAKQERILKTWRPNGQGGETILYHRSVDPTAQRLNDAAEMVLGDIVAQYGKLSIDEVTSRSKETLPFANAKPRETLFMNQSAPLLSSPKDDWELHLLEIEQDGTISLEQMVDEFGLG